MNNATTYMAQTLETLQQIEAEEQPVMTQVVEAGVEAIQNGGVIYLFGTGHSHLLAEEGHYRAGGLAAICPILSTTTMLHEGAVLGSTLERTSGIGPALLKKYRPTSQDMLIIFSNSGVNTVPVEMAIAAQEIGMTVIAVVARAYAAQAKVGSVGKKLADVADLVLDNHGPPGDALVDIGESGVRTGPISTIAGAFLLNAILTEVACRLAASTERPPVYISSNMPNASTHNAQLVEQYRQRNPHL